MDELKVRNAINTRYAHSEFSDDKIRHALQRMEGEETMKKKVSITLICAVVLLLIAATAFATAYHTGLIDYLFHIKKDPSVEADKMIETNINQEGGILNLATFIVKEAMYDGHNLHFSIIVEPTQSDHSLVDAMNLIDPVQMDDAKVYGSSILGAYCEVDHVTLKDGTPIIDYLGSMGTREDASLVKVFTAVLPPDVSPDLLVCESTVGVVDTQGDFVERSALVFEISRTVECTVTSFDVDVDMCGTRLLSIKVSHTPLELGVSIVHDEKDKSLAPLLFELYNEDGIPLTAFSTGNGPDHETGHSVFTGIYESAQQIPEILTLNVVGGNMIARIDLASQTVEIISR